MRSCCLRQIITSHIISSRVPITEKSGKPEYGNKNLGMETAQLGKALKCG